MEIEKINPKKQWEQPQVKLISVGLDTEHNDAYGFDGGTSLRGAS